MRKGNPIIGLTLLAAASSVTFAPVQSQSIKPDTVLGSSLSGWRTEGHAQWRMENGQLVGTATGPDGGWLIGPASLQDVGVTASVRCAAGCKGGILVRRESLPDGGTTGLLVSLAPDDLVSYRVKYDASGKETNRQPLTGNAGMNRLIDTSISAPTAAAPGSSAEAPAANGGTAGRGRGGSPPGAPITLPDTNFRQNDWNTVEILVDANVLKPILNGGGNIPGGATDKDGRGFGPVALYVGSGEVRFRSVGYKDLAIKTQPVDKTSPNFREQRIEDFMYSWGVTVADINKDNIPDIIAGPNYYAGPSYTEKREFTLSKTYSPSTDSPVFQIELAADFTGDGWVDIVDVSFNRPAKLYVNPKGQSRRWDMYEIFPRVGGELALLVDLYKDGRKEILMNVGGALALVSPDRSNPTKPWTVKKITNLAPQHGMGVGDINGDGKLDVLVAYGWWEQPARESDATWTYHPAAFGRTGRGGAEMAVYDINGDGLNDVITGMEAHDSGISWFEQKRDGAGSITFAEHKVMGGLWDKDNIGISYTQIHGSTLGDVSGDGVPDFIAGKRYWSHHESLSDPDPNSPPYLYAYETVRDKKAPGGARFVAELINNRAGAGSQVVATDLNKDGATDIVTTGAKGTWVFWGKPKK